MAYYDNLSATVSFLPMGKWKSSKQNNVNILKGHPPLGVKTVIQMPDSYSTTGKYEKFN